MSDLEFVPIGKGAWALPIKKDGRQGRDGDGDGVFNEGQADDESLGRALAVFGGTAAGGFAGAKNGKKGAQELARIGRKSRAAAVMMEPVATKVAVARKELLRHLLAGIAGKRLGLIAGFLAGGHLAGAAYQAAHDTLNKSEQKMSDITFAPKGSSDWMVPVKKAGKAGRDGDGDGVLNEGAKGQGSGSRDSARLATGVAGGALAGAGAGGLIAQHINRTRSPALAAHAATGSGLLRTALAAKERADSFRVAPHGAYTGPNAAMNRLGAKTAEHMESRAVSALVAHHNAPAPKALVSGRRYGAVGGLIGAALGGAAAYSQLNKSDDDAPIAKSEPVFTPLGGGDHVTSIAKDGRKGRDGDGDGVKGEGRSSASIAASTAAGAVVGAALGVKGGGRLGVSLGQKAGAMIADEATSKPVLRQALNNLAANGRLAIDEVKSEARAARTALTTMIPKDKRHFPTLVLMDEERIRTANRANRLNDLASKIAGEDIRGAIKNKLIGSGASFGGKAGKAAGAILAGSAGAMIAHSVSNRLEKFDVDAIASIYADFSKAYAEDILDIEQSDLADKAEAIAKVNQMMVELIDDLKPSVEFAKNDGVLSFEDALAQIEITKVCDEAAAILDEMAATLTKSASADPKNIETAVAKFDAGLAELLSQAVSGDEADVGTVAKAAAPVFRPLVG